MVKVTRPDGKELTEKEKVQILVSMSMGERRARLALAWERGDIIRDVVIVDDDDKPVI